MVCYSHCECLKALSVPRKNNMKEKYTWVVFKPHSIFMNEYFQRIWAAENFY